ncbi:MAG: methyltransferase domain-containing protein [Bacteroidota bacterium]|nr:methyltransferase domain-containing protein [Bacteroidota bacterium]
MNLKFYQKEYAEKDNITAEVPEPAQLAGLKETKFLKGNKNADRYSQIFQKLLPGKEKISVLDYGSSWGYISWQLIEKGYDVQSFEISKPRADYGNTHLGLNIVTNEEMLRPDVDIFFSSHVIEHHPSIPSMIQLAKKLLKPGGYFIAVSPNGSKAYRERDPFGFHKAWGKVHPNYLNADFYSSIFSNHSFYLGSSPFNIAGIAPLASSVKIKDDLSGEELLAIVKL